MVTAYDVAERARVSISTVSRYLTGHGYVSESSRIRIAEAVESLGYVPSRAAASLTTKTTGLLGFIVSDLRNPFTAEISSSLSIHARANGYGLVLTDSMNDPRVAVETVERMRMHGVEGLVVTPPESEEYNAALVACSRQLPIVGIGLRTEPQVTDLVTSDTMGGAMSAVQHLISLGHVRIAYVGSSSMASGRYRGFESALKEAGLPCEAAYVIHGELDRAAGFAAAEELCSLPVRPTAIFAANDAVALGVIQSAHARGWEVPRQVSVVGYDDVDLAAHSVPPLTTVAQPMAAMGKAAVDLLMGRLKNPPAGVPNRVVELPASLVVRGSTAVATDL